jgi:hypothetical protein
MEAASVAAVQFAKVKGEVPVPAGFLVGTDGSRLAFTAIGLAEGKLTVASFTLGEVTISAERAAGLQFRSDRLAYLSDLEPADAKQTSYFDEKFPFRRDRAADGQPIRLGGVTYEKGLGLHSRSELVFDLGGRYKQLTAIAGIDEGARMGMAYLTILGDGKPLLEKTRLSRQDPPRPLRLDVSGTQRLAILVDFGEGTFGVSERVDLADAKLVK